MKLLAFLLLLFPSLCSAMTDQEMATDFVYYSRLVSNYLQRDLSLLPEISRERLDQIITQIKVVPVDARPLDNRGVEKAAVFNRANDSVQLHRLTWSDSNPHERAMIATMELLGLAGMDRDRYELAATNIFPLEEDVKKLEKVQEQLCLAASGQSAAMFAGIASTIWECRAQWRGNTRAYFVDMETRYRRAVDRCVEECAYGHIDQVLKQGWCLDTLKQLEDIKAQSRKDNGKKCI